MDETWRPIKGYSSYFVSNRGEVWSEKTQRMLTPTPRSKNSPYLSVILSDGKNGTITKNIHRLVAEAFVENPYHKEVVNHIDGNKNNNAAVNLEWTTRSENDLHAFRIGLRRSTPEQIQTAINSRKRKVIDLDSGETFESITDCARSIGGKYSGVFKCVSGIRKRYMGRRFAYNDIG